MRHALLIAVMLFACYAGWQVASPEVKGAARAFVGRHLWPVLLIVGAIAAMLVAAVYIRAPSII